MRFNAAVNVRVFLVEPAGNRVYFDLRLFRRDARLQTADHLQITNVAHQWHVVWGQGHPQIGIGHGFLQCRCVGVHAASPVATAVSAITAAGLR